MSAVEQIYSADIVEIVLDLPFPPSSNRIWRRKHGQRKLYPSPEYTNWKAAADAACMAHKQFPRRKIGGHFTVHIQLSVAHDRGDSDNRIKPLLDWCQSRDIVRNDRDCRGGSWGWVSREMAPAGVRVTLRSLHGAGR